MRELRVLYLKFTVRIFPIVNILKILRKNLFEVSEKYFFQQIDEETNSRRIAEQRCWTKDEVPTFRLVKF